MIQNTEEWHKYRLEGIGASEAPVIMGLSRYMTPYQLWEIKTSKKKAQESSNFIQSRGHELEIRARAHYELLHDEDMPPTVAEHKDFPWVRASLDGWNEKLSRLLEIKFQGIVNGDHDRALAGIIREDYMWQLTQQFIVTGANEGHFVSYNEKHQKPFALIIVKPDIERCEALFKELEAFWHLVKTDTPPELTKKDIRRMEKEAK